jgi:uncharacterized membrane protein YbhN (UPF0104 family)
LDTRSSTAAKPADKPNRQIARNLLGLFIFAVFVAFVEHYLGWAALLAPWRELSPAVVLAAMLIVFVSYAVRAIRVYAYFYQDLRGAYPTCVKLFLQHNLLNNLLPMRSGELSFPVLMSRYFRIPVIRSVSTLLWFRMLDLHSLLSVGIVVFVSSQTSWLWWLAVLAWLPLPYFAYLTHERLYRYLSGREGGRITASLTKVLASLPRSAGAFWTAWMWTLLNWVVKVGALVWILLAFLEVPLVAACMGVVAGDLTSVLPIHSVAGAGTFEAGVVAGLIPFGVAAQQALQAAVNLHLFMLGSSVIGGGLSLLLPVRRRQVG